MYNVGYGQWARQRPQFRRDTISPGGDNYHPIYQEDQNSQ
jgi:hypothetical protein